MATILMIAGGALVNAVAMGAVNYGFQQLSPAEAERQRHNKANENLQKARDLYSKQRTDRIDFINKTVREQQHAAKTFQSLDAAMKAYYEMTKQRLPELPPKPQLSDFYALPEKYKDAELAFIAGGLGVTAFLLYKYL